MHFGVGYDGGDMCGNHQLTTFSFICVTFCKINVIITVNCNPDKWRNWQTFRTWKERDSRGTSADFPAARPLLDPVWQVRRVGCLGSRSECGRRRFDTRSGTEGNVRDRRVCEPLTRRRWWTSRCRMRPRDKSCKIFPDRFGILRRKNSRALGSTVLCRSFPTLPPTTSLLTFAPTTSCPSLGPTCSCRTFLICNCFNFSSGLFQKWTFFEWHLGGKMPNRLSRAFLIRRSFPDSKAREKIRKNLKWIRLSFRTDWLTDWLTFSLEHDNCFTFGWSCVVIIWTTTCRRNLHYCFFLNCFLPYRLSRKLVCGRRECKRSTSHFRILKFCVFVTFAHCSLLECSVTRKKSPKVNKSCLKWFH